MCEIYADRSEANMFVDSEFDRLAEKRTDPEWLAAAMHADDTRFILVWKHRCAIGTGALRFASAAELTNPEQYNTVLLGKRKGYTVFAVDLGATPAPPEAFADWAFEGLRAIGSSLPDRQAAIAAYAQAMVFWIRRHRYCGQCGSATRIGEAGHVLDCLNPDCGERSFPRSDPAVIVLATDGERLLLGRQAAWPAGRYSTIAGFVEPGESLETAVRREVAEETGHRAFAVDYFASQPWPFPSSLMLGFTTEVSAEPYREPDEELEDVRWFSRTEIIERTLHGPQLLPPPMSIAYRLVEHWFDRLNDEPLAQIEARHQR